MRKHTAIVVGLATLLGVAPAAVLASTASIVASAGGEARVPLIPLRVDDRDYPPASLVATEAGRTVLLVSVGADGRVTDAKVSASSGYRRLDDAAVEISKGQWAFWPSEDASRPTVDEIAVQVDWDLPFEEISTEAAATAFGEDNTLPFPDFRGGVAPRAMQQAILADDYPLESLRNNEQGIVRVRMLIQTDGMVGRVDVVISSGIPRLDEAAQQMIMRRWRYRPATVNGMPIEIWQTANVAFQIDQGVAPPKECREQPILANERVPRASLFGSLTLRRQVFADQEGRLQSSLLLTQRGWMRLRRDVWYLGQPMHYNPKPMIDGMPASCWYDADVTVKINRR